MTDRERLAEAWVSPAVSNAPDPYWWSVTAHCASKARVTWLRDRAALTERTSDE